MSIMGKMGRFAVKLAHKHPVLDAVLVGTGAVAILDVAYTKLLKPKPSTAQTVAKTGG